MRKELTVAMLGIAAVGLAACARQPQGIYLKAGATQSEFSQERYACMQQSQQPASAAYADRYGGVARSNIITNNNLFDACMNSRGWYLSPVADVKSYSDEMKAADAEVLEACASAELQVIFSKKTTCKSIDLTPEMLSDRSKITSAEKAALMKWHNIAADANARLATTNRQYNSKSGEAIASVIERTSAQIKDLVSELYDGHITWGEYNKRRLDLNKRYQDSMKTAVS